MSVGFHLASYLAQQRVLNNTVTAFLLDGCAPHSVGEEWLGSEAQARAIAPNLLLVPIVGAYINCVDEFWRVRSGASPARWSTGLLLVSLAMELCDHVHVYGFWPFEFGPDGQRLPYHYNNRVPRWRDSRVANNALHSWPDEHRILQEAAQSGAITLHAAACQNVTRR